MWLVCIQETKLINWHCFCNFAFECELSDHLLFLSFHWLIDWLIGFPFIYLFMYNLLFYFIHFLYQCTYLFLHLDILLMAIFFLTNYLMLVWIAGAYFNGWDRVSPALIGSCVFHQLKCRCFVSKHHTRANYLRCVIMHAATNLPASMTASSSQSCGDPFLLFKNFMFILLLCVIF